MDFKEASVGNNNSQHESGGLRDAAEYKEASYQAELPPDSFRDILLDVVDSNKTADQIVDELLVMFKNVESERPGAKVVAEQKVKLLEEFLYLFDPAEWTVVNWWAIHFAIHTKHTEGITVRSACRMLNVNHPAFCYIIQKWRRNIRLIKNRDLHREGCRIAGRKRRSNLTTSDKATCRHHTTASKKATC